MPSVFLKYFISKVFFYIQILYNIFNQIAMGRMGDYEKNIRAYHNDFNMHIVGSICSRHENVSQ